MRYSMMSPGSTYTTLIVMPFEFHLFLGCNNPQVFLYHDKKTPTRPTLSLDAERKCCLLMIRRRVRSFPWVVVFNRWWRSPYVRLLLSRTRRRTFEMASCDTPVILNFSLWENPRLNNRMIFSVTTGRILVVMIATLVWDDNLHTATAHN